MEKAEPPGSPEAYPPADFRRRCLARLLDLAVAAAPLLLAPRGFPRAGALLAAALILSADALFGPGQSLGKRLAGLRAIVLGSRRPAGLRESVRRNAIFVVPLVPAFFGTPLPLVGAGVVGVLLIEAAVALRPLSRDPGQRRLGDLYARTQVIDARLALGIGASAAPAARATTAPMASRAARERRPDPVPASELEPTARPPARDHLGGTTGAACASP